MRYQPALNIWNLSPEQIKALPIGQWIYAGDPSTKGRFYGQGRSTVIAWHGRGKGRWAEYCKALHAYGKTVKAA